MSVFSKSQELVRAETTAADGWKCHLREVYMVRERDAEKQLPAILSALMNSRRLGHVCIPCDIEQNTKDKYVQYCKDIQPLLQINDASRLPSAPRYVTVQQVTGKGIRFDVLKKNNDVVYFTSNKVPSSIGTVGLSLSQEKLLAGLLDVQPSQIVQPPPKVVPATRKFEFGHLLEEVDSEELKETRWWRKDMQSTFLSNPPDFTQIKKILEKNFQKYIPRMYGVTALGQARPFKIFLGFCEKRGALGMPLSKAHFKYFKSKIEDIIQNDYFPCFPGEIYIDFMKLEIPSELLLRDREGKLILMPKKDSIIESIRKDEYNVADFCCAVRFDGDDSPQIALGILPERIKKLEYVEYTSGKLRFSFTGRDVVELQGNVATDDRFTILDHYSIAIRVEECKARSTPPLILYRDSFSLHLGMNSIIHQLSPMAVCAWLAYEKSPQRIPMMLATKAHTIRVFFGSNVEDRDHLHDAVYKIRGSEMDKEEKPDFILAVGCHVHDVHKYLHVGCQWSFVDYDVSRLEETLDGFSRVKGPKDHIADIMLVPQDKFDTVFNALADSPISVDPMSNEGRNLVRDCLEGKIRTQELWGRGVELFNQGTVHRARVVKYLSDELFAGASQDGPFKLKSAVSITPGSGTTTILLQLIASLQSSGCFACFISKTSWNKVLQDLENKEPSKVLLILDCEAGDNKHPLSSKHKQDIQAFKDKLACTLVVFHVQRLAIFHDQLPRESIFTFPFTIEGSEKDLLIDKFKAYFTSHAPLFDRLRFVLDSMLVDTPATLLRGADSEELVGKHASKAIQFCLNSLGDDGGDKYLQNLCLLTCTSHAGRIRLGQFKFITKKWSFLITDPTESVHSLTSRLWIPVLLLCLAPHLKSRVEDHTYVIRFDNKQAFAEDMVDALQAALKTGSGLRPWTTKKNSRIPVWLEEVSERNLQDQCLNKLITYIDKLVLQDRYKEEKKARNLKAAKIQLHILLVDVALLNLSQPKKPESWREVFQRLENLLALDPEYYLIQHFLGKTYFKATIECCLDKDFVKKYGSKWMHCFERCLKGARDSSKKFILEFLGTKWYKLNSDILRLVSPNHDAYNAWIGLEGNLKKLLQRIQTSKVEAPKTPTLAGPYTIQRTTSEDDEVAPIEVADYCDLIDLEHAEVLNAGDAEDEGMMVEPLAAMDGTVEQSISWFLPDPTFQRA
eukprot:m.95666 g.95666  ORF g.95666 m.95666 type:complete len:1185 (+) comp13506_c0_seq1:62-3616(+)